MARYIKQSRRTRTREIQSRVVIVTSNHCRSLKGIISQKGRVGRLFPAAHANPFPFSLPWAQRALSNPLFPFQSRCLFTVEIPQESGSSCFFLSSNSALLRRFLAMFNFTRLQLVFLVLSLIFTVNGLPIYPRQQVSGEPQTVKTTKSVETCVASLFASDNTLNSNE